MGVFFPRRNLDRLLLRIPSPQPAFIPSPCEKKIRNPRNSPDD
jgi:hypothetical protein